MTPEQKEQVKEQLVSFGSNVLVSLQNDSEKTIELLKTLNGLVSENPQLLPFLFKEKNKKLLIEVSEWIKKNEKPSLPKVMGMVSKVFNTLTKK